MKNYKLGDMELEFANLIWENEPISSGGLVQLCEQKFSWKKSTTYTMLKRLCDKGIFQNNSGNVVSVLSKQEWFTKQSEGFVEETFNGSLPVSYTHLARLLQGYYSGRLRSPSVGMASLRLLSRLTRMFEDRLKKEDRQRAAIDRKLRRKIEEKKQLHGLRME